MNDLRQKLGELPSPQLDDASIEQTIRAGQRRYRRQRQVRTVAATLGVLLVIGIGAAAIFREPHSALPTMTFADGSTAALLDPTAEVRVTAATSDRFEVALERGRSRFEVAHDPRRKFRVIADQVVVEVIGTRFVVELTPEEVSVEVERGRVRVQANGDERFLSAGEGAKFPRRVPAPTPTIDPLPKVPELIAPAEAEQDEAPVVGNKSKRRGKARTSTWRATAAKGNYEAAYGELAAGGAGSVRDVPEELMLAADVSRWSRHPEAAVPYLERVVREHKSDPRSQLAAFTLGRVLLEELGRPREAASAFARARALDASGPLAGDALAREVEAWSRAGDSSQALVRAEEYLQRYPKGSHTASVRRFGRLE
jgi:transmembrane sensor